MLPFKQIASDHRYCNDFFPSWHLNYGSNIGFIEVLNGVMTQLQMELET